MGRFIFAAMTALAVVIVPAAASADAQGKLGKELHARATRAGWSRVIVTLNGSADVRAEVVRLGGTVGRRLALINGQVVELPNGQLKQLANHPAVARIDEDRPTRGLMSRVAVLTGARKVHQTYGYDGAGVGVAVIDSGITSWHDDLTYQGSNAAVHTNGNQRVAAFVDFVNGATVPSDDNGHGTHVSGIIAGNGYDSGGSHAGMAPAAHVVSLKVLDRDGRGVISDVIAAFEHAVAN